MFEPGFFPRGTDHRFLWSVIQGLRRANFHENLSRQEAANLRSIFAFFSSFVSKGLRCFSTLSSWRKHGCQTDDTNRSSVPPLTCSARSPRAHQGKRGDQPDRSEERRVGKECRS